ncbi:MAG TPA: DEAD/DEAH box helicase [Thermomicrobiaceae bacterium]|nr:DEAD/DEAH box helicase [Thermomicrobiaceae bacterium]
MALENLIPLLAASDSHLRLVSAIERLSPGQMIEIEGLAASARYPLLAALLAAHERPTVILAGRQDSAEEIATSLAAYLPDEQAPEVWPVPEPLPYEQLPLDREAGARRVELLRRLRAGDRITVVVPARGLTQLLSSPEWLVDHSWALRPGSQLRPAFVRALLDCGYQHVNVVEGPGQVAHRGGIIDVFPPGDTEALRIELFGDQIDSLRAFDPGSQRTTRHLTDAEIAPPFALDLSRAPEAAARLRKLDTGGLRAEVADEWRRQLERLETGSLEAGLDLFSRAVEPHPSQLLDYLSPNSLVIVIDPASIRLSIDQLEAQAEELRVNLEGAGELPAGIGRPYHRWAEIEPALRRIGHIALGAVPTTWVKGVHPEPIRPPRYSTELPIFPGRFDDLVPLIGDYLGQGWVVALASDQSARLTDLLEQRDIFPRVRKRGATSSASPPPAGTLELAHARLNGGWRLDEQKLILLTDQELFGYHRTAPAPPRPRGRQFSGALPKLVPGTYVVHIEHGIARFAGMVKLDMTGVAREYLRLDYAENDRLYLPVDRIDRITPYEGPGLEPKLTRLGSPEWARVKQRVRQAVREMAFELLQLYAAREASEGHAFSPDIAWDVELAESFAFVETPDQARAIQDVKGDMETVRPMDRLVCGDVGYGKTEVALRAAFKAVNDGFQVAVLVPTTILALQHFHTFRSRLAAFPVKVEMLSRLRTKREQQEIVKGLGFGAIDIVIGTHRLLQSDVQYKQLGLLVIDEEQRFGVAHKEQVKRARATVDVLTMTATPIPRTLHMALSGIRDLSIINTPPRDRTRFARS